jgi:hypothetical protein
VFLINSFSHVVIAIDYDVVLLQAPDSKATEDGTDFMLHDPGSDIDLRCVRDRIWHQNQAPLV